MRRRWAGWLLPLGRLREVEGMWSETITRHPTHAEAILERAGTRWHWKTRAEAVDGLKLAVMNR
jgi:hypothetical protein